jgi:alkylation response protein AidB-like acyl-CoA dehydrogenase
MDFFPDDEQLALIDSVRSVLDHELPTPRSQMIGNRPGRELFRSLGELGWFSLGVAESDGGVGATVVEEMLLFREIGRALAPGPLLSTLLGARLALAAGASDLAGALMAGEQLVAFAERHDLDGSYRVFDADLADLLMVLDGDDYVLVPVPSAIDYRRSLDELTSIGHCATDLSGDTVVARAPAEPIRQLGWVLASAMCTGIAEATRDLAVEYLHAREAFGKPIGSFQGLKHKAADMAVQAELANSVTTYAALLLARRDAHTRLYAMAARSLTAKAAMGNARVNVQMHGAMGTTLEHDSHLFTKRAHFLNHYLEGVDGPLSALLDAPSPLDESVTAR